MSKVMKKVCDYDLFVNHCLTIQSEIDNRQANVDPDSALNQLELPRVLASDTMNIDEACDSSEQSSEFNIKQEIEEVEVGPTIFQPPDICYNLLPVIIEASDSSIKPTKANARVSKAGEHGTWKGMKSSTENSEIAVQFYQCETSNICPMCGYETAHESPSERRAGGYAGAKPYECNICSCKTVAGRTTEKPYSCSICDFRTAYTNSLKLHMKRHTGEKPQECSICGYKTTSNHLKRHMRKHSGVRPYKCLICNFDATQSGVLKIHMNRHYGGGKLYHCSICEYKTARNSDLARHVRWHTGERPYECAICDYKTTRKEYLKSHMKLHTGKEPYHCSMCEYKTVRSGDLDVHMRQHTGRKLYQCSFCEYKATRRENLTRHVRRHTGVEASRTLDLHIT